MARKGPQISANHTSVKLGDRRRGTDRKMWEAVQRRRGSTVYRVWKRDGAKKKTKRTYKSKATKKKTKRYVNNSYNRKLGRVGKSY